MKTFVKYFSLAAIFSLGVISCSKEIEYKGQETKGYKLTFAIDTDTKSYLADEEGKKYIAWEAGDMVGVVIGTEIAPAEVNDDLKIFTAYFDNAPKVGDVLYAYTPCDEDAVETMVDISLPGEQELKDGQLLDGESIPMVTTPYTFTEDAPDQVVKLQFNNMASIIAFRPYGATYPGEKIKSVTFQLSTGFGISGERLFDLTQTTAAALESAAAEADGTAVVVNTYGDGIVLGEEKGTTESVYMAVWPGTWTGNIVVTTDKATYRKDNVTITADRAAIKTVNFDLYKVEGVASRGIFTIDPTAFTNAYQSSILTDGDVEFSYFNLMYNGKSGAPNKLVADGQFIQMKSSSKIINSTPFNIRTIDIYESNLHTGIKVSVGNDDNSLTEVENGESSTETFAGKDNNGANKEFTINHYHFDFTDVAFFSITAVDNMTWLRSIVITYEKPCGIPDFIAPEIEEITPQGVTDAETDAIAVLNSTDKVIVPEGGFTGCVTSAVINEAGKLVYSVAPNYSTTETPSGTITLALKHNPTIIKTVNISQGRCVFDLYNNKTEAILNYAANDGQEAFTAHSSFKWVASVSFEEGYEDSFQLSQKSSTQATASFNIKALVNNTLHSEVLLGTVRLYREALGEDDAEAITITVKQKKLPETLVMGALSVSGTIVSWSEVIGASSYEYKITKTSDASVVVDWTTTESTSIDVATVVSASGSYNVSVKAIGDGENYITSEVKSSTVVVDEVVNLTKTFTLTFSGNTSKNDSNTSLTTSTIGEKLTATFDDSSLNITNWDTVTAIYQAGTDNGGGFKFSSSNVTGTIKFTLNKLVKVEKVEMEIKGYETDAMKVTIGSASPVLTSSLNTESFETYEVSVTGSSNTITIAASGNKKRAYVKSVKVYYKD